MLFKQTQKSKLTRRGEEKMKCDFRIKEETNKKQT